MNIKRWLKDRLTEISLADPNSSAGFRERARRLIQNGTALDNPTVTMLLKRALIAEHRDNEIPELESWTQWSDEDKEQWVLSQLPDLKKSKERQKS